MSDSKDESRPLKSKLGRVADKFSKPKPQKPRRLVTENLEARILFSGTPAAAPDAPAEIHAAAVHEYATHQTEARPSSLETLPAKTVSVEELVEEIPLSKTEIQALLTLSQTESEESESDSSAAGSENLEDDGAISTLFLDPLGHWERSESTHWEPSQTLADENLEVAKSTPTDFIALPSTLTDNERAIAVDVYLDPSIFAPLGDGFQQAELHHEEPFELTLLATLATVGTFADRQTRREAKSQHPSTFTAESTGSETAAITVSGQTDEEPPHSRNVEVDPTGTLNFLPLVNDLEDVAPAPKPAPIFDDEMAIDSGQDRLNSNPSAQLFIDDPTAFDFTTLQSGNHGDLVNEADPFFCIESTRPRKNEGRKTKLGKIRKKRVATIPLGRSRPGSEFVGDSFSIEAWIRPKNTDGAQMLFSIEDEFGLPRAFVTRIGGDSLLLRQRTADFRYKRSDITIPNAFEPNCWHHLVIVRESSKLSVFIDGVERTPYGKTEQVGLTIFGPNVHFGSVDSDSGIPSLDGSMSGFSIYGYPLSPGAIVSHYNEGLASGPYGSIVKGIVGLSSGHQVFVSGDGRVSQTAYPLVHDSPKQGSSTENSAEFEISIVQNILDRIADQSGFTAGPDSALGVFLSNGKRKSKAEFSPLRWGEAESILDHFGVPKVSPSEGDSSRCLFLSGTPTGKHLEGFVAEIGVGGRIDSVTPLDLSQQRHSTFSGSELISSLKAHASANRDSDWEKDNESRSSDDSDLRRVSSVQSDVFFGSK